MTAMPPALDAALAEFAAAQSPAMPPPGQNLAAILAEREAANAAILNRFQEVKAQSHQEIAALRAEAEERVRADMEAERQARTEQLRAKYSTIPVSLVARMADDPNADRELVQLEERIVIKQKEARTDHELAIMAVRNVSHSSGRGAEATPEEMFRMTDSEFENYKRGLERGGR